MTKTTTETTVAPKPSSVPGDDAQPTTEHIVRAWVAGHLSGSHIARNVDAWNELQAALPALVAMIDA